MEGLLVGADGMKPWKIPESCSIASIWELQMLENGARGAEFCRAWANSCAAMMKFSEEE